MTGPFEYLRKLRKGSTDPISGESPPRDIKQSIPLFAGLEAIGQQDWPGAISAYRETVRRHPDFAEGWVGLGVAYQGQGDYTNAAEAYQEAIRRRPDHAGALFGLGEVYAGQGKHGDAVLALSESVRLEPTQPEAWHKLGRAHFELQECIWEGRERTTRRFSANVSRSMHICAHP